MKKERERKREKPTSPPKGFGTLELTNEQAARIKAAIKKWSKTTTTINLDMFLLYRNIPELVRTAKK